MRRIASSLLFVPIYINIIQCHNAAITFYITLSMHKLTVRNQLKCLSYLVSTAKTLEPSRLLQTQLKSH